jgi:FtsH-binding integral membrane protein
LWALLALLVFGIFAIFVSIPNENLIWSIAGLVIFGGFTTFDFNRLRRAGEESAAPIAAQHLSGRAERLLVLAAAVRRRARVAR